jgi:hypothetical protein
MPVKRAKATLEVFRSLLWAFYTTLTVRMESLAVLEGPASRESARKRVHRNFN